MQYFVGNTDFEVFDEFNGVPGTYIKSFLISDKINLNKWQATWEGIISNLDSAIGRPGIYYRNPETKKLDHTGAPSKKQSLAIQELYRAASIIAVGSDIVTKQAWQVSKMVDENISAKIKSGEIKWISPSLWPEDGAVEIINSTDGDEVSIVHDFDFLHYAFVDEPAFGDEAEIKSFCDGTTLACQKELAAFTSSVDHITEYKIKIPNSSENTSNTSLKIIPASETQMASEEELRKELEEAKKSKKAMEEEEDKEKKETAKKAETEKKKDEEIKALKAQVESLSALAKSPIIDKIISAQLSASVISKDSESETRKALSAATIESLTQQYELIKPFETRLNSLSQSTVPYMGSYSGSFDASLDEIDDEVLLQEVSQ